MPRQSQKLSAPNIKYCIEGHSLILCPISENELNPRYLSWINDPEINKYLEVRHKEQTIVDLFNYVNSLRSKPGCEVFAIFTKENKIHVGNIAITMYDPGNLTTSYGLMVGDARARQIGAGGQATLLLLEYIFKMTPIRRVWGGIIADNLPAQKILQTIGFTCEGALRQHYILSTGQIVDGRLYGIMKEEWEQFRPQFIHILKHTKINRQI